MKTLMPAAIRCSLMFAAVAALSFAQPAHAYTITLEQVGSNVVATGSGAIDLTGLSFTGTDLLDNPLINPFIGFILTGASASTSSYTSLAFSGPLGFGQVFGSGALASSGSGDLVGIFGSLQLVFVPDGYVSGTLLSDSATYNGATFASLGATPGTYVWTWGAGANQNFTLQIGAHGVPDGGSTIGLLILALAALFLARRAVPVQS
jgi:hypothetical protein